VRAHVRVPATSANLGPGFDALGLALALYNEVEAEEGQGITVRIEGEGADRLPRDGANVVARGVRLAFETAGRAFKGCALTCVNRIPAARGLGSSAAAWVGGLVAGMTYGAKKDSALEHYQKALKLNPDSAIARIEYANGLILLFAKEKLDEAQKLYEQAAKCKPADAMERFDVELAKEELS